MKYNLYEGDSITKMHELADDGKQYDLSVFSPPFPKVFAYSPDDADMGNAKTWQEFILQFEFFSHGLIRLIKPGRNVCVHVQQVAKTKGDHGDMGLFNLRGYCISAMEKAGFSFYGEVTIPKNPQAQSIRLKAHQLQFTQWEKDSSVSRPSLADYLIIFKAPGKNEVPIKPLNSGLTRDNWIDWAESEWTSKEGKFDIPYPKSVWRGIRETHCLNNRASVNQVIGEHHKPANTKFEGDEIHMCPLQLDLIERCILLWSNKGETVFTPFAGIGSELVGALMHERNADGIDLKREYLDEADRNCQGVISRITAEKKIVTLFDLV